MHLHRLYTQALQVNSEEGLGGYVTIDEDRIVADRAGQDVRDRVKDKETVFPKQEGHVGKDRLTRA
jgi:hypothetical protein